MQQLVIKNIAKPKHKVYDEDIKWLCNSFGFSSGRDLDFSAVKVLSDLLEKFVYDSHIPSEAVASSLNLTTGIVNHHVRNLSDSGIVYRERKMIVLRGGSLKCAVEEMRKDANRVLDEISMVAEEIDQILELKNRI